MNRPIYLHVFDRELRTFTQAQLTDELVCNVVVTASLLSDVVYMSNSNLMESSLDFPRAVSLVYELEKSFQATILATTDNPEEFKEKRQRLYHAVQDRYPMYFDDDSVQFPSLPFVLKDSTTEFLRSRILEETREVIPVVIRNKYDDFRNILTSRSENGVTVGILDKYLNFVSPERRYAAHLISESYTVRYMNVLGGQLMKNLPGLAHFDYLSESNLFFDCYYPVLNQVILRFLRDEGGHYMNDIPLKLASIKANEYFVVFMSVFRQSMDALYEYFKNRSNNQSNKQFVFLQWRQVVHKYFVYPFHEMTEFNLKWALEIMIRSKDNLERDYSIKVDMDLDNLCDMKTVLYVVATPTELKKVTDFYKGKGVELSKISEESHTYWDLGVIRKNHVFLVKCEMGAKKANASILTIDHAIGFIKPDYVIMVGIRFALREDKLNLGDVMIATELWDYGSIKMSEGTIIERGNRVQADKTLLDRFTNAVVGWEGPDIRFGLVITNDVLCDDESYVKNLRERFPDAIGGEMEGCGLLANYQTPWILVKAVCDFGHDKGDEYQGDAAMNAIKYVDYVLTEFDL